jgi:hypothetical protein
MQYRLMMLAAGVVYEHKYSIETTKITTVMGQIQNRGKTHYSITKIKHFAHQSQVAGYLKRCRGTSISIVPGLAKLFAMFANFIPSF